MQNKKPSIRGVWIFSGTAHSFNYIYILRGLSSGKFGKSHSVGI